MLSHKRRYDTENGSELLVLMTQAQK